jgi:DNA-binding XRE family transcriptional regulator
MLTKARERAYITQEVMAGLLGVARTTYATYETGTRTPTLFNAARISEILKTPIRELFPEIFGTSEEQ